MILMRIRVGRVDDIYIENYLFCRKFMTSVWRMTISGLLERYRDSFA